MTDPGPKPMPSLPSGFSVVHSWTTGMKARWNATASDWNGPLRKSERSAICDAQRKVGVR